MTTKTPWVRWWALLECSPRSLIAACRSRREALSAGSNPKRTPAITDVISVNRSTRSSTRISGARGSRTSGSTVSAALVPKTRQGSQEPRPPTPTACFRSETAGQCGSGSRLAQNASRLRVRGGPSAPARGSRHDTRDHEHKQHGRYKQQQQLA